MDVSIDQGGCVETSRPTTYQNPTYIEEGVIHYCVPNMTGVLARTTTHAFNNAAWPYIQEIAAKGLEQALADDAALRRGLNVHKGEIVHPALLGPDMDLPTRPRTVRHELGRRVSQQILLRRRGGASSSSRTNRLFMTGNCSVPKQLLAALVRRAPAAGRRGDRARC